MKPLPIFIGTLISLNITACVTTPTPQKMNFIQNIGEVNTPKIAHTLQGTGGGNPEVNLNLCLKESYGQKIKCLNNLFPTNPTILLVPKADGKRILLAGRGESIDKREITLSSDTDIIVLNIDSRNVKTPLKVNITTALYAKEKNNLVLTIPVKDIEESITLKDREGKLVLEYTIIRE